MKEIGLRIDQMKHLKELGVDCSNASMIRTIVDEDNNIIDYGVFTLQDMLELLPKEIMYPCDDDTFLCLLNIQPSDNYSNILDLEIFYINDYYRDESPRYSITKLGWLNAVYDLLCWLAEHKYLSKK